MEKRYDVFISYSAQDQKVVEGVCGFLEREGYRCFVAYRDIPRGVVWASAITDALDASKMMVVVFSNAFNMSKQTDREIEIASENDMPILTYRVAKAEMTGAKKYYLKNLNWIDAFPNPENYFGRLLDSVVRLIGSSKIVKDNVIEEETKRVVEEISMYSDTPGPKNKKSLWIAFGAIAVLAFLLLLLWPKKEEHIFADLDTETFQGCQMVEDYRSYIAEYGQDAEHYTEAKDFIDRYVADSLQQVQGSLNRVYEQELLVQQQAENEVYGKCTTVKGCDNYLKTYPNGRYADQVRIKKAELVQQTVQQRKQQQTFLNTLTDDTNDGNGTSTANGYEYVDLGLPSGTLWATCNIGSSSPEDYGNYFAWGEIQTKSNYDWTTYKYAVGRDSTFTKYCTNTKFSYNGYNDNLSVLQGSDDAARANCGNEWCTPTKEQWNELLENTTNQWIKQNGVFGRLFSARNGQTLFLPAAGCRRYRELRSAGFYGFYWSSSLDASNGASGLYFVQNECHMGTGFRFFGFPIRPVRKK